MNYTDLIKKLSSSISWINNKLYQENLVREELQKIILYSIYTNSNDLYFLWWTNLRICYNLDRFSEDLDFALNEKNINYDINKLAINIDNLFKKGWGYDLSMKLGKVETVQKINIKFWNILYDLWISPLKDEKIMIKIEVDTNPSYWALYSKQIIESSFGTFVLKNQNIETTFSGKIWALLLREYTKWRDYYDLYWYLTNYSYKKFNQTYISSVIKQYNVNNNKNVLIPNSHKDTLNMVLEKLDNTNFAQVKEDLKRFVDWSNDKMDIFFDNYKDNTIRLIKNYNDNINSESINKSFRL